MLAAASAPEPKPSIGYITATRLASELDVCLRTISNWVALGLLPPPIKIRGRRYFKIDDVKALLNR
jgi:DNA-binding transcriptional MerR regulator